MKKYTFLTIAVVVIIMAFAAFKNSEKEVAAEPYILVEIYEIPKYEDKGVHIHWGNNKTEFIPFKEFVADHHDDNGDIILNAINKLTAQGYEIDHTASGVAPAGMITKIFMRKK